MNNDSHRGSGIYATRREAEHTSLAQALIGEPLKDLTDKVL